MTAGPVLLAPDDSRIRRARRAISVSLLAAALSEAVTLASKDTPPVYSHAPWLNDPYDTAVSFALFCIPLIVAPSALRLAAGSRSGAGTSNSPHRPRASRRDRPDGDGRHDRCRVGCRSPPREQRSLELRHRHPGGRAGPSSAPPLWDAEPASAAQVLPCDPSARLGQLGGAGCPDGAKTETPDWLQ